MKTVLQKAKDIYFKTPIFTTFILSFMSAVLIAVVITLYQFLTDPLFFTFYNFFIGTIYLFPLTLTAVLTVENIFLLFAVPLTKRESTKVKYWEIFALIIGLLFSVIFLYFSNLTAQDWHVQLINEELHTPYSV